LWITITTFHTEEKLDIIKLILNIQY